jgi:hypothetical protein
MTSMTSGTSMTSITSGISMTSMTSGTSMTSTRITAHFIMIVISLRNAELPP